MSCELRRCVYLMLMLVLRLVTCDMSLLPPQEAGDDELQGDGSACKLESRGQPTERSNRSSANSI